LTFGRETRGATARLAWFRALSYAVAGMFEDGDTLGPYTIVRRLGAGAMGEVYQARHRHMGRDVAIKLLRTELTEESDIVARFFTEARATAAVRHPGIVEIFDCDLHRSGRAFIVMEYLVGEDLARRLADGGSFAADYAGLRAVGRQLASALAAAHALGIVHRDLKPGNIFLVGQDAPTVKIVDFGIAKLLHRDGGSHSQTQTGHILGTPLYMSPEQARGAKTIDHRTDIYALGCVLFEMITGQPPFVRKGPAQVIVAHLHEPAPRASSLAPSVPSALDELVAQMMAKDPSQRPQAMTDVLARLAEPAAAAPGHVATQLLPGARSAGGSGPVVTAPTNAKAAGSGPAPARLASPRIEAGHTRLLANAGSTTLGNSASELVAVTEHVASPGRPPRARGALIGAATAFAVGLVVVLVLRSGTRGGGAPAPAAGSAPIAAPPEPAATLPAAPAEAPVAAPPPVVPPPAAVAPSPAAAAPIDVARPSTSPASPSARPAHHHHEHAKSSGEFKAIED
jgi:tRNA A-37 threonylcarbamoyl transferase component Bud32